MKLLPKLICSFSLLIILAPGFSQGLQFRASNQLISDRTSYHVFNNKPETFKDFIEIRFDFAVIDPNSFGYILYMKDIENNLYYNLSFTNENDSLSYLKLSKESKETLISIPLYKNQLGNRQWIHASIRFDSEKDSIYLKTDQNGKGVKAVFMNHNIRPEMYFGKHESFIDVPEIAIKNLEIRGKKKSIVFPFNEIQGQEVHDTRGRAMGKVENPVWLINESYNWRLRKSFVSGQVCAINFSAPTQEFIMINKDSLTYYNIRENTTTRIFLEEPVPVPMRLGSSFLDERNKQLYIYEINDVLEGMPTIASLSLDTLSWNIRSYEMLGEQRHHHVNYLDTSANKYFIFGGFGNKHYSNEFYSYDLSDYQWNQEEFTGDTIQPRFFSGLTALNDRELILFGGVGNPSGDQAVGRIYYSDCYHINLDTRHISRRWEQSDFKRRMVAGRNMILSSDSTHFYTLYYPEYIPNTFIKLYKFSIENGSYEILGDSIPMVSERIRTNANIYLNNTSNEIYCVSQEFKLDGSSNIKIYSISNTPISRDNFYKESRTGISSGRLILALFVGSLMLLLPYYFFIHIRRKKTRIKKQRRQIQDEGIITAANQRQKKNAVYLFGNFRALDKNSRDISHLFSPKIKQLFLLILLPGHDRRVTSSDIYAAIWPNKSLEKAKNSKGVTLNQLRKILRDIDGIELINENKQLYFLLSPAFYCDYLDYQKLILKFQSAKADNESLITGLISIVSKGKFLDNDSSICIDRLKEEFENEIFKIIPYQLDASFNHQNYLQVIEISSILFNIDLTNELAFHYELLSYLKLNLEEKAKRRYNAFIIDYKQENNDGYPFTFRELSRGKSLEFIKQNSIF